MKGMEKRLGKGLASLITSTRKDEVVMIDINRIQRSVFQPRRYFDEESLKELAESIKSKGLIEPIIVRLGKDGNYELICGERRLRACKIVGINKLPAIIKDISDEEAFEIALIENIQREDLTPIELALAFEKLSKMGYTHDEIARKIGKSRSYVTNIMRILNLPDEIKELIEKGKISLGHAKVLSSIKDENKIKELAKDIVEKDMSVRQVEEELRKYKNSIRASRRDGLADDGVLSSIKEKVKEFFPFADVKVKSGKDFFEISLKFKRENLEKLVSALSNTKK
jgi:ParB family chromosome partitioning protein